MFGYKKSIVELSKIAKVADPPMGFRSGPNSSVPDVGRPAGRAGLHKPGSEKRRWFWLTSIVVVGSVMAYTGFRITRGGPSSADETWQQAERDLNAGRFDLVETAVRRLAYLREPTPLDTFLRAQLAMARNDNDLALIDLARVPDQHYMAPQARLLAGQTELRRNRVRLAEALFREALKLDPKLIQAHRELIYIYGMQLRRRELNAEFTALSRLTDLTFDNAFHWCLLRNNSWEPGEAITSLASYVEADPDDRASRLALAENYVRMNRLEAAEGVLGPLPHDDSEAVELRARIALERHDLDEADRLLAQAKDGDPAVARLQGRLALASGNFKTAVARFRIAYADDPDNRETIFGLMSALESSGDRPATRSLRTIAGNLDRLSTVIQRAALPDARGNADLMRQVGAACAALERKGEARAWYKLAIGLDPLDAASQQALFRLNDPSSSPPQSTQPSPAR